MSQLVVHHKDVIRKGKKDTDDGAPTRHLSGLPSRRQDERAKEIRVRAYEKFQQRLSKGSGGDALSDWLEAEHEVLRAGENGHALECTGVRL